MISRARPVYTSMLELSIRGPIEPAHLPGLVARVCGLLGDAEGQLVRCEVSSVAADAVAVDALARLALAALRRGCEVRLYGASEELCSLVHFMGLSETLRVDPQRPGDRGSPNSGNRVSVSRKKVNSMIRPSRISITCSAHGS